MAAVVAIIVVSFKLLDFEVGVNGCPAKVGEGVGLGVGEEGVGDVVGPGVKESVGDDVGLGVGKEDVGDEVGLAVGNAVGL